MTATRSQSLGRPHGSRNQFQDQRRPTPLDQQSRCDPSPRCNPHRSSCTEHHAQTPHANPSGSPTATDKYQPGHRRQPAQRQVPQQVQQRVPPPPGQVRPWCRQNRRPHRRPQRPAIGRGLHSGVVGYGLMSLCSPSECDVVELLLGGWMEQIQIVLVSRSGQRSRAICRWRHLATNRRTRRRPRQARRT